MTPVARAIPWETRSPLPPGIQPSSALRLDARLRWWVDGEEIAHPRTLQALARGLRQDAAGWYTSLSSASSSGPAAWRAVQVEDCPLGVSALREEFHVELTDGRLWAWDPEHLVYGPEEGRLRLELCPAEGIHARFLPAPYHALLMNAEVREGEVWIQNSRGTRVGIRMLDRGAVEP